MAYYFGRRGYGYGGGGYGRDTDNESYWADEEGVGCRDCGHPGPEHRHLGICPDMIRLEPHVQRLIGNARRGDRYGFRGRHQSRRYSYDDLDDPYDERYRRDGLYDGMGRSYRRSGSRDRLANAVEDLAEAVDDAGEGRDRYYYSPHRDGRRYHHHHRHHHGHHHRHYHRHGRHRYGRRLHRSYGPRLRRSRSCDRLSDCSDSDDERQADYDGRYRTGGDAAVDDLADTLQRAQLLRVLGDRDRGNQRLMREVIRNT